jgi:hypothetical protein
VAQHDTLDREHVRLCLPGSDIVDAQQVVLRDVDEGIDLRQRGYQVGMLDRAHARLPAGSRLQFPFLHQRYRVTPPGEEIVEHHRDQQDDQYVFQYRRHDKTVTEIMGGVTADHGGECGRTTGRVYAAQVIHGTGGESDGQCGGGKGVRYQQETADTGQRRDHVSAKHIPRLRQGAMRYSKQQYGGGSHGWHDQQRAFGAEVVRSDRQDQVDRRATAECRDQPLGMADSTGSKVEQAVKPGHQKPSLLRIPSAMAIAVFRSPARQLKWPILRPGRAWCLPYRCRCARG